MDKSAKVVPQNPSASTAEQKMDVKLSKLSKKAIKEKLKDLERMRKIRLSKSLSSPKKLLQASDTCVKLQSKKISLEQLFSSSETERSVGNVSTDEIDNLSELRSDCSLLSFRDIVINNHIPNNQTDHTSSDEKILSDLTPSANSEDNEPALDRDIAFYNLSNDHCYSGSESATNLGSSPLIKEDSLDEVLENSDKETGFEVDTDASGCAEIIICNRGKTYEMRWQSEDGSRGHNSTPHEDVQINKFYKKIEIEIPSTPESQIFESDENVNSLQAAKALLNERFRDMIVFSELISLKIKQLKSQKRKITNINDVTQMLHRLFRFNTKCERNFKFFNDHLIRNIKTLKVEYNIPVDIHIDSSMHIPQKFKHLIKDCSVKLQRCDHTIKKDTPETICDILEQNCDTDKEITSLTNLSTLKRKQSFGSADKSPRSPKKAKMTSKSEEELYSSDSTHVSTLTMENSDCESNPALSINELAKKQILENSMSDDSVDLVSDEADVLTSPKNVTTEKELDKETSEHSDNDKKNKSSTIRIGFSDLSDNDDKKITKKKSENSSDNDISLQEEPRTPSKIQFELKSEFSISSSDGEQKSPIKEMFRRMKKRKVQKQKLLSQVFEVNSSDSEGSVADSGRKGRKNIRDILDDDVLDRDTQIANIEEIERLERLTKRNISFSQTPDDRTDDSNDFILDFDPETKEPLVKVHPHLNKHLKPHQREGIQFMWDSCYESLAMMKKKSYKGQGCILAHCMGLGKTLQVITLAHTVMRNKLCATKTALVICPRSVALNWREEIIRWLQPFPKHHKIVYDFTDTPGLKERTKLLQKWHETGGFMLISYDMYRILMKRMDDSICRNKVFDIVKSTLRYPGPDIVFLDEGHILKNEKTIVRKQIEEIQTKRRVILTGTPMQNNLKEYYWMVHFVKPKLLGTFKEYSNRFANPILNGQHKDSKERDIKIMKKRSHVLHKLLEGSVQRKEVAVLKNYLPEKFEYVLMLMPSAVQERLYNHFLRVFAQKLGSGEKFISVKLFSDFQALKRVWTHPYALVDFLEKSRCMQSKQLARASSNAQCKSAKNVKKDVSMDMDEIVDDLNPDSQSIKQFLNKSEEPLVPWDWWKQAASENELDNIFASSKLTVMFDIMEQCKSTKEKILVFSSSLNVLNSIEYFLKIITTVTRSKYEGLHPVIGSYRGIWEHTLDYFRFDGKLPTEERQLYCKKFNDVSNERGRLFLVSTRAGGIGLNMTGANRVIILDVSWNPAIDTQSIFRAYRLQQKKTCYIYRLIAMGFMEQKIYERSVTKEAVACRVVDELQIDRHYSMAHLAELYALYQTPEPKPIPKIPDDSVLANLLPNSKHIYSYHEHDSLLMNLEEEELMPEEQALAWEEFLREKDPVPHPLADLIPQGYLAKDGVIMHQSVAEQYEQSYASKVIQNYAPSNIDSTSVLNPYAPGNLEKVQQQNNIQALNPTYVPNPYVLGASSKVQQQNHFQPQKVLSPVSTENIHRTVNSAIVSTTTMQSIQNNYAKVKYGNPKSAVERFKTVASTSKVTETIDLTSQPNTPTLCPRPSFLNKHTPILPDNSKEPILNLTDKQNRAYTKHMRSISNSTNKFIPYSKTQAYIQKRVMRIVDSNTNDIENIPNQRIPDSTIVLDPERETLNRMVNVKSPKTIIENLPLVTRTSVDLDESNDVQIISEQISSPNTVISNTDQIESNKSTNKSPAVPSTLGIDTNIETSHLKLRKNNPVSNTVTSDSANCIPSKPVVNNIIPARSTGQGLTVQEGFANEITHGNASPELAMHDYCQKNPKFNIAIRNPEAINSDFDLTVKEGNEKTASDNCKAVTKDKNNEMINQDKSGHDNSKTVSDRMTDDIIEIPDDCVIIEKKGQSKEVKRASNAFNLSQECEENIEASLASYLHDEERKQKQYEEMKKQCMD